MDKANLLDYLSHCPKEDAESIQERLRYWDEGFAVRSSLASSEAGLADTVHVLDLERKYLPAVEKISQESLFQNSFKHQAEIRLVEIDKLVALHGEINLEYAAQVAGGLPKNPTVGDLIPVCLPIVQTPAHVEKIEIDDFNTVYYSDSSDLRVINLVRQPAASLLPQSQLQGIPVRALVALIGFGFPAISAIALGRRLVLNNGFHRLYALKTLGVAYAPMVVVKDSTALKENFNADEDLVLKDPRPPLFKDFFDPRLSTEVTRILYKKAVKVSVTTQRYDMLTDYDELMSAIIREQIKYMGEKVALRQVRGIPGLKVGEAGEVIGGSKKSLEALLKNYSALEGQTAMNIARNAIKPYLSGLEDLPASLKEEIN
jgi:hypothetical protein